MVQSVKRKIKKYSLKMEHDRDGKFKTGVNCNTPSVWCTNIKVLIYPYYMLFQRHLVLPMPISQDTNYNPDTCVHVCK